MLLRGAIRGKYDKIVDLPGFCKKESAGSSIRTPPCYRGLIWLWCMCRTGGALVASTYVWHLKYNLPPIPDCDIIIYCQALCWIKETFCVFGFLYCLNTTLPSYCLDNFISHTLK